jgi:hypothetical protein
MVKKIKNFKTFADKKNKGKLSVKPQPEIMLQLDTGNNKRSIKNARIL